MTRRSIAVVSAFRPSAAIMGNIAAVSAQVDEVIVVDDGSGEDCQSLFSRLSAMPTVTVVRLINNSGIAAALNAGIQAANLQPGDLVLTLDQDSKVPDGFVTQLVKCWDGSHQLGRRPGLVAPARFAGQPQVARGHPDAALEPIQSGTLYSADVLFDAGPLREELFIDLVDTEYFYRLRALGYETLAVEGLDLPHRLGRSYAVSVFGVPIVLLGRPVTTSLAAPFRVYYQVRNRLWLARQYGTAERRAVRHARLKEIRHLAFVLGYARPRLSMLRLIREARRAYREERMGRIPREFEDLASTIRWAAKPVHWDADA